MSLAGLVGAAVSKTHFATVGGFLQFCARYLNFVGDERNYQAQIVSQNERNYRFYQYREDGNYNITRPINLITSRKMGTAASKAAASYMSSEWQKR